VTRLKTTIGAGGLLACALLAGCGPGVEGRYPVCGKVTYNGEPIANGSIVFVPADPDAGGMIRAGGTITDGQYEIPAKYGAYPGSHQVEIVWLKPTGRKITADDPPVQLDERVNVIPAKYNKQTELVVEIKREENVFDFALAGKVPPKP
jgi:hypothetical protein